LENKGWTTKSETRGIHPEAAKGKETPACRHINKGAVMNRDKSIWKAEKKSEVTTIGGKKWNPS